MTTPTKSLSANTAAASLRLKADEWREIEKSLK
jgi:hypothetical protein